jgi:hypothetical protein
MRKTIEPGGHGATYHRTTGYTVYEHGVYPRHSVLAGQASRRFVGHYATLEEAQAAHPDATLIAGTTYQDIETMVAHLPDEDEEGWRDDD